MTWFSWKLPILSKPNYFRWPFFWNILFLEYLFFISVSVDLNLKATFIFFFKFWMSVIMIMPARLWISRQVVCDRSMWLMLLYLHALLISWVLSIWLISPVFVSWYHGFGFISIFFGLIRVMLFVELLLIRRLSNSIGTEWALATFYVFFLFM